VIGSGEIRVIVLKRSRHRSTRVDIVFFAIASSTSPGMAISLPDVDGKYPVTFKDADGE
jgi:hypothetical protein